MSSMLRVFRSYASHNPQLSRHNTCPDQRVSMPLSRLFAWHLQHNSSEGATCALAG
jgi:hypothetical protein